MRPDVEKESETSRHLPTCLFVGPMKCGTSWIHSYLAERDDVCLNRGTKETFFFDQRFESKGLSWYKSHFQHSEYPERHRTIIEVAPTYFHDEQSPSRIFESLGPIQIVVTLRSPADRAFSLFQHMRRYGMTRCQAFRDAFQHHSLLNSSSHYSLCLRRWQEAFGEDRVSVLWLESLKESPERFAREVCDSIKIPYSSTEMPDVVNEATVPRSYAVAALGRIVGDAIRSVRAYWIVEAAKSLGMKQLFFGRPQTERSKITEEDRRWFQSEIAADWNRLSELTPIPAAAQHGFES